MANPGQLGLTPDQKLVVGAGVTRDSLSQRETPFDDEEKRSRRDLRPDKPVLLLRAFSAKSVFAS